jgi:hypothetical protein
LITLHEVSPLLIHPGLVRPEDHGSDTRFGQDFVSELQIVFLDLFRTNLLPSG